MSETGISVVVPAWNVAPYIDEALASVSAQAGPIREILAVDDGSTDGTSARLAALASREPRLRLLRSERGGPAGARNLGLAAATQPLVAFLDGDDLWPAGRIERQLRRLAADDRPEIVSGLVQRFRRPAPGFPGPEDSIGPPAPHVNLGACLFRRAVFDRIGRLDDGLRQSEDVDLMFRVREAGLRLAIMREVTLLYRIRPGSLTQHESSADEKERTALAALRRSIRRRRQAGGGLQLPSFDDLLDP
jgi:glycosyltransferase involved in cell wall biosynthesis